MSQKLVETRLYGYEGPVHISHSLTSMLAESKGVCGIQLDEVCVAIPGYKMQTRPTTYDGYGWFWGQHFTSPNWEVVVLFPWAQDWEKTDGSSLDRAVAVYTKGTVSEGELHALLGQIAINLGEALEKDAGVVAVTR